MLPTCSVNMALPCGPLSTARRWQRSRPTTTTRSGRRGVLTRWKGRGVLTRCVLTRWSGRGTPRRSVLARQLRGGGRFSVQPPNGQRRHPTRPQPCHQAHRHRPRPQPCHQANRHRLHSTGGQGRGVGALGGQGVSGHNVQIWVGVRNVIACVQIASTQGIGRACTVASITTATITSARISDARDSGRNWSLSRARRRLPNERNRFGVSVATSGRRFATS